MLTNYRVGDVVVLKKNHACDKKQTRFEVVEIGAICKIKCLNCQHEIVLSRDKLNESIIKIDN